MTEELIDPLTAREEDVLKLLRRGFTNVQLAEELGISENTAKDHVSSILRKLGARSRDEAAYWPDQAPWWARAPLIAPLALFLRRFAGRLPGSPSMAATVLAGAALIIVVAGLSLLAMLLLRTSGGEEAPQGRWLSLLALIPDTERSRDGVAMNDHALARELFGIERPAADVDEEGLIDYISALGVVIRPAELLVDMMMSPDASRSELGFTIADVDFDASVLDAREPGATGNSFTLLPGYEIVRGRVDERTVEEALRTDPAFSDLLEQTSYHGVDYYHRGYEGTNVVRQTGIRLLGEGRQLVIRDGTLYWTELEEDIENMIDAAGGNRASLAGREEYQLVARALDGLGTYSAYLSSETANDLAGWEGSDVSPADLAPELALVPYAMLATGRALDSGGAFLAVVLVHDDEDDAAENVVRLGERIEAAGHISSDEALRGDPVPRWSELIRVEIVQDGRLLIAKLYPNEGDLNRFRFTPLATLLLQE